jgi:hypothetical protein
MWLKEEEEQGDTVIHLYKDISQHRLASLPSLRFWPLSGRKQATRGLLYRL